MIKQLSYTVTSAMIALTSTAASAAPPPNYVKVFEDHFDGTSLDTNTWTIGLKDPASGDLVPGAHGSGLLNWKYDGYIAPDDVWVSGGNLVLQNQKRTYQGTDPAGTFQYTSGWIMSMHKLSINGGYVEFRAQMPTGDKVWPALWMVSEDLVWGPEWDMWEYFGYRADVGYDNMGNHLLYDEWPNEQWATNWISTFDATYDASAWHVYGFEWTGSYAKFFIDGVEVNHIENTMGAAWPNEDMYFILNNGTKTESPDSSTTWPNQVTIDYMEVYQFQADSTPPSNPTGLVATAGNSAVDLDWADNTDSDLNEYGVYRSETAGGPYTQLTTISSTNSNYTDATAVNDTTYYYVVTALDTSSNESTYSNEITATPNNSVPLIIVGGSVNNGDFNNPNANSTFTQLANWSNLGSAGQSINATQGNDPVDGSQYAVLGYLPGNKEFAVDTGHTLVEGDSFNLSYVWKDGWLWDDNTDNVIIKLFVTNDNTVNGTATVLATDLSGNSTSQATYENYSNSNIYTASSAVAGKTLFVSIDTNIADEGYAQLDNFELSVIAGEPGPALPGEASSPSPSNGAKNVSRTPTLAWTAGSDTDSHDVYFGTDAGNLTFQGNQTSTSFNPAGTLAKRTNYYWRIDEVNAEGTTTGTVWTFKTKSK